MPLSDDDKQKYKDLYVQSAKPYIADLEKIASWKAEDIEVTDTIHRAAHSLGSQSLMMEYNSLAHLSRLIEKIFKRRKDGDFVISDAIKNELVGDVAKMKESVDAIATKGQELDLSQQMQSLQNISKMTWE